MRMAKNLKPTFDAAFLALSSNYLQENLVLYIAIEILAVFYAVVTRPKRLRGTIALSHVLASGGSVF